jgi:hypothetical protein
MRINAGSLKQNVPLGEQRSKTVKRLTDDKAHAERFLQMIDKLKANRTALDKAQREYEQQLTKILAKHPDLKKLKSKVDDLQGRDGKIIEQIEKFLDFINEKLRDGYKSMYFLLEIISSTRRTISYKSVCEKLVKDKKVKRDTMNEYYEMFAKYCKKETTKFLDQKSEKFIEIYTYLAKRGF